MTERRVYENLAHAIVLQAVKDYRLARKSPRSAESSRVCRDVERFFKSPYFRNLTNLNGEVVLKQLQEEADEL